MSAPVAPHPILVVDNHDSFVHTLIGYFEELGATVSVREADEIDPDAAAAALKGFAGVVISPGPGAPEDAGASIAVVRAAAERALPLLGVCLGHQALAVAYGASVAQAPELMHGMTSAVEHGGTGLFAGIPSPFTGGRYHSLSVRPETIPADLVVTARTAEGTVMALAHRTLPLVGVQFHPESVLTEHGYRLLGGWLESTGLTDAAARGAEMSPHRGRAALSPSSA
ncbi:gamma-glutamyl-gamma-aminobutyrate hydrolase family protein [Microbacterium sp. cx-55]|uniref:anthranilate synthase component II n=1 Tax=Microbacterium sp. cx-55 TaxID=2875948 RepID=UPI001CBEF0D4|nr:gamma-glutamyl-gamma-aminobutyrate hydrolase family protein [Microbacterium sp. cx-55]UGB35231.1 gamma-glutamyl-gamma-aminobutyrate hydrolase family protein [Microbacterium sp. cx-55]